MSVKTDISLVMSTEHGRRLVRFLLDITGVESSGFTEDERRDTFNAGKREIGIILTNMVRDADFDQYIQMVVEARNGTG